MWWGLFGGSVASQRLAGRRIERYPASADEQRRVAAHPVEPEKRHHYRYVAADYGWRAASLMPDGADETALVLATAGSWIKYLDPVAADRFYKALVRRCRNTDLSRRADQRRWFPELPGGR